MRAIVSRFLLPRCTDTNRFMPFRQTTPLPRSALDTCISSIKGSSPPTRTRRTLIRSSCLRLSTGRRSRSRVRAFKRFARQARASVSRIIFRARVLLSHSSPSADMIKGRRKVVGRISIRSRSNNNLMSRFAEIAPFNNLERHFDSAVLRLIADACIMQNIKKVVITCYTAGEKLNF